MEDLALAIWKIPSKRDNRSVIITQGKEPVVVARDGKVNYCFLFFVFCFALCFGVLFWNCKFEKLAKKNNKKKQKCKKKNVLFFVLGS